MDPVIPQRDPQKAKEGLSTFVHSGLLSWENTHVMREKTAVTKGSLTCSVFRQNLSRVGNSHKRLTCSAFMRLLPGATLLVLHEVWLRPPSPEAPTWPLSTKPHVLTELCPPEKGFLTHQPEGCTQA